MIRILQCVNNMHRAGLETALMNYYRNIDRTKIQFDFLMHRSEPSDYDNEIESLGGRIYRAPRLYPQNYPTYFSYMRRFFAQHPEYRIVHSHIDSMSYFPLLAAKWAGVPVRIAHSHSASLDRDAKYLLKQLYRLGLGTVATHRFSCGQAAGEFLFRGKDFHLIPNAIEAEQFCYQDTVRLAKRRELGLEGQLVLGHAGRFTAVKNHEYLLEVFSEVLKKKLDGILLLIGTGELETRIRNKVTELGITESVRFLGNRSDMSELYQAMDILVVPSFYEGVPLVGLEAQFAGLPCVFSDRVSQEVCFTNNCHFLSLKLGPACWAEQILQWGSAERDTCRSINQKYDIKYAHKILEAQYMELDQHLQDPMMVCE